MPADRIRLTVDTRSSRRRILERMAIAFLAGGALVAPTGCRKRQGSVIQGRLFVHCAAVLRRPMTTIAQLFRASTGTRVDLQFGGSNTLLSQVQLTGMGDIYIAADESYLAMASRSGICDSAMTLGVLSPVLIHRRTGRTSIEGISDLLRPSLRVALAHPEQAAIGRVTRDLLRREGLWDAVLENVSTNGVFMPTVGSVASAVALGSADVGVVWHSVAMQQKELVAIADRRLGSHVSRVQASVLNVTTNRILAEEFLAFVRTHPDSIDVLSGAGIQTVADAMHSVSA